MKYHDGRNIRSINTTWRPIEPIRCRQPVGYFKSPSPNKASYTYKLHGLLSENKQLNDDKTPIRMKVFYVSKIEQKNSIGVLLNTFAAAYDRKKEAKSEDGSVVLSIQN